MPCLLTWQRRPFLSQTRIMASVHPSTRAAWVKLNSISPSAIELFLQNLRMWFINDTRREVVASSGGVIKALIVSECCVLDGPKVGAQLIDTGRTTVYHFQS
jgi:hypothetical protein